MAESPSKPAEVTAPHPTEDRTGVKEPFWESSAKYWVPAELEFADHDTAMLDAETKLRTRSAGEFASVTVEPKSWYSVNTPPPLTALTRAEYGTLGDKPEIKTEAAFTEAGMKLR